MDNLADDLQLMERQSPATSAEEHAARSGPSSVALLIDKLTQGVCLTPAQERRLAYGLRQLVSVRDKSACASVMMLLRCSESTIAHLLGSSFRDILVLLLLCLYDGDCEPLYALLRKSYIYAPVKGSIEAALARLSTGKWFAAGDYAVLSRHFQKVVQMHSRAEIPAEQGELSKQELAWLTRFLRSAAVPNTAMNLEEIDGFFSALISAPVRVLPEEYMARLWGDADGEGPAYDSREQAEFVGSLLMRHWLAIETRLKAGQSQPLVLADDGENACGQMWARGFMAGVSLRPQVWMQAVSNADCGEPSLAMIAALAAGGQDP